MGVEGDVLRYRFVPVIRGTGLIRRREPSLERIMRFCRVFRLGRIEAVLFRLRCNFTASLRIIGDRTGRELEVAVEHQTCRHLGAAGIGAGVRLIRKPAEPCRAFHGRIRNIVRQVGGDIVSEGDILRADQRSVIVIERQGIRFCIIVEVEAGISRIIGQERPKSGIVFTEVSSPGIRERTVCSVLCLTPGRRVACLGVTCDLIPVVHIAQIVVAHVDRPDTAVCLAVVGRRGVAFRIVLQPVFKVLIIICRIIVTVQIDRIFRAAVRADTQRRHDRQALELAVVLVVVTPTVLGIAASSE